MLSGFSFLNMFRNALSGFSFLNMFRNPPSPMKATESKNVDRFLYILSHNNSIRYIY